MSITQQIIAMIGADGEMGSALAKGISAGNYRMLLFGEEPESLKLLTAAIHQEHPKADIKIMDCAYECSWEADIIVLDISEGDEKEIAKKIQEVATQKIVVRIADSTNTKLHQWLPNSKIVEVVKHESESKVIIYADDQEAAKTISEIMKKIGFHANLKLYSKN